MLPLRYPWLWRFAGWLLVVGVVAGSLMPGHSIPSVASNDKVLHGASYFLLMLWFAGMYRRSHHLLIGLGLILLGAALDALQALTTTRHFDVGDIVANAVGVLVALVLSYWLLEGWCQRMERWLAPS